ncbi:MAG: group I truncated hemoglobin [Gammaproteobacteria bacterium]
MKILPKKVFKLLPLLILVAGIGCASAASAEDYYADFGGQSGMTIVADHFLNRVLKDQRIAGYFAQANIPELKKQLAIQFCMEVGGPCTYRGPSMKTVHQDMGVNEAAFNSLVEDLIYTMNQQHVPISAQNALLKKLAPMEKVIVTR